MRTIVPIEFVACNGSRPHERHLPARHVVKLRNFIQRITTADGRELTHYPGVGPLLGGRYGIRDIFHKRGIPVWNAVLPHGAELEHRQRDSPPAYTPVANQGRAAR